MLAIVSNNGRSTTRESEKEGEGGREGVVFIKSGRDCGLAKKKTVPMKSRNMISSSKVGLGPIPNLSQI